ncbi:hypothetical protein [Flavobacterium sp.]|jgi:hypothetical protein|uniref:hypothetical protein n=1 Tax=Flavobacterium sp. TaxID=239 RepID=UPI0037BE9C5B
MKYLIRIALLFVLLPSFQCDEEDNRTTPEILAEKKQEILNYIQSFSCANATGCLSIAFGAKPCGGPREFLVYPNTVDQTTLETLVEEYYEMDHQYNIETGAVSDCMVVGPPNNIDCVNGVCTIID